MNNRASVSYWESVWEKQDSIVPIDLKSYKYKEFHEIFQKFIPNNSDLSICEIGCAMSSWLLYFNDYYNLQINGFDYDKQAVEKTSLTYKYMGYKANIYYGDFFVKKNKNTYDILSSWGVFEHFNELEKSIKETKKYLTQHGIIITSIPNMNGITGFYQKFFNKKVYDIHIPYTKQDILQAHEKNGYKTLFCNYVGTYQFGVVNISGIRNETFIRKLFSIPGKPLYILNKIININSKLLSPHILYIGVKN